MFKELPDKINLPQIESEVLDFWKKNSIFQKSISTREGGKPFRFYEGPPTANGKPGIHHVISRAIKDLVCRYKTLRGYQVYRKAGWDTQGLPVEIEVEKKLGIKHKDDILKFGVEKFNEECRNSVFTYLKDWEELTERMGYWVNLDDAYVTYKNEYIESVWWSLKKFFDAGKIYKGHKIQPYCPHCETPLSTHEVAQGYEDVKDPSVYVKFKIKENEHSKFLGFEDSYLLVWTTTPWTLISNAALAIHPMEDYVQVMLKDGQNTKLILMECLLSVLKDEYEVIKTFESFKLEELEYEPLFNYVIPDKKAFYVVIGNFVSAEDGSGIVHIAPAFGEDDYQLSKKYNLPVVQPVNKSGEFEDVVSDFKGRFVKEADDDIIAKLKSDGKLYRKEKFVHSYPHCWRCHTPLLYFARDSWYINTSSYKEKMIEENNKIHWYPPETGTGRFSNWLEENRDWALSRDRFWGTPLPIWECTCKDGCECEEKYIAIGSIAELKEKAVNFKEVFPNDESIDLHKPFVDEIKIRCEKGKCDMTRVEQVIDAWYDSGSMPFAQYHYMGDDSTPEGKLFRANYPADFIAEGVDQTRGWFYTLHAIGTFVFGEKAYKNLIVHDMILDKNGKKMSKHVGNIVNPFEILEKYGADITRWYLISSSPPWRPKSFNEEDLVETKNKFFDTLINTYKFFILYSNLTGVKREELTSKRIPFNERPEIDRWIISYLNTLKRNYVELMDGYDITKATRLISDFTIDDVSNWYVRRNRRRFREPMNEQDKISAYQTLYEVLAEVLKMVSPFSPFLSEKLYKDLTGEESVHLSSIGDANEKEIDSNLETEMQTAQQIVYLVRTMRVKFNLKTRQPLRQILIPVMNEDYKKIVEKMKNVILEEVNVKEINFVGQDSEIIKKKAKANFKVLGPKFGKDVKQVAEAISNLSNAQIVQLEKEGKLKLELKDKTIQLEREDIEVQTENIEGWVIESKDELTVALDIKLDDELMSEGFAREFISKVQSIRKENHFEVNDRISIKYFCEDELNKSILSGKNLISKNTMAETVEFDSALNSNGYEEVNINGKMCKISIKKIN